MEHIFLFKKIEGLPEKAVAEIYSYVDYLVFKYQPQRTKNTSTPSMEELFFSLAGSWQSEETGDELNQRIYNARNDSQREVLL